MRHAAVASVEFQTAEATVCSGLLKVGWPLLPKMIVRGSNYHLVLKTQLVSRDSN